MRKSGKKKKEADPIDEVEELLKLTQEDLLLKLTVNSNTNSKSKFVPESSSNAIDPDLDRRFQALRSKPSNPKIEKVDDDDLFARFAALKGTDTTSKSTASVVKNDDDEDEEDEVSRIINWAIDAARLDPSPDSDMDENGNDDDEEEDSDEDSSDDDDCSRKDDRKKKVSKKG